MLLHINDKKKCIESSKIWKLWLLTYYDLVEYYYVIRERT